MTAKLTYQTENIMVRAARTADSESIFRVAAECRLGFWRAAEYRKEIDRTESCVLVAERRDEVLGFIAARFGFSEDGNEIEADIINVGVLEKYRRRGIGEMLFRHLLQISQKFRDSKIGTLWLEVRKSNAAALEFYQKNGFTKVQERKNFYTNPNEDAVVMCLKL